MQSVLITDSNILFDLYHGGILDVIALLPYEFWIPDFAIIELKIPSWSEIEALGIVAKELTSQQVQDVYSLHTLKKQLSVVDISAYMLAKISAVPLLTGDGHLRNFALQQGVEVHGLLWLLDEAVLHHCLEHRKAALVLQRLINIGSRLPKKACQERIDIWLNK